MASEYRRPLTAADGPLRTTGLMHASKPPGDAWAGLADFFRDVAYWIMAALMAMSLLGFERAGGGGGGGVAPSAAGRRLMGGGTSSDEEDARGGALYPAVHDGGAGSGGGGAAVLADGELAVVGGRVQTQWTRDEGGDDGWYAATIVRLQGQRATVHYDDGDMWTGGLDEMYSLRGADDEEHDLPLPLPQAPPIMVAQPTTSGPAIAVGVPLGARR